MLGTIATQQVFASANSIAALPTVWAEWNYNSFNAPYVTTSHSDSQALPNSFNSVSYWNVDGNGTLSTTAAGTGILRLSDQTASALLFTVNNKLSTNTNTGGDIYSVATSNQVTVNAKPGTFYKFVFYVKSYGTKYSGGFPSKIPASSVNLSTNSSTPSSTSATYYYRVVPINSQGLSPGPDMLNNSDAVSVFCGKKSKNTLSWSSVPHAAAYTIYRSINNIGEANYLTRTSKTTYQDDLSKTAIAESYSTATFSPHVFVVPQVIAKDSSGTEVPIPYFIKSAESQYGQVNSVVGSIQPALDVWKKVEIWFGSPAESKMSYDKVQLRFSIQSEHEGGSLIVDDVEMYRVTEHDYFLNEYFPTESVFAPQRPGEALTNPLLPSEDKSISKFNNASRLKQPSLAVKSPQIYFARELLSPNMQMLLQPNDVFKYYVSDQTERSIQAQYNQFMSINKIVIKHINTLTVPTSGTLTLYTGSANNKTTINLTSASFNSNGTTVLYYNGSSWSTSSWTSPPQLNASAQFQNVLTQFRGMTLNISSVRETQSLGSYADAGDLNKVHIVELSPRMELDLTPFLLTYDNKKELASSHTNGFPISYLNSNTGQITFSNIPVYSGANAYSVFENSANSGTFSQLLRQGIKFTTFLSPATFQKDFSEKIPQFTMYSNTWTINDIDSVTVELFDFTKNQMQVVTSPHFAAKSSNLFSIITTMLNACGISDYDYDGLKNACSNSVNTKTFWFDETKTIFQNLQDLFIVHQIGGWVDEYGILRFKSLGQIYNEISSNNFATSIAITDKAYTITNSGSSINYIANIVPNTYTESLSEKVGTVQITYRTAGYHDSINNDNRNKDIGYMFSKDSIAPMKIWSDQKVTVLSNDYLDQSLPIGKNYMQLNPFHLVNLSEQNGVITREGDLFIGDEIVGINGWEYHFYPYSTPNYYVTKIVKQEDDINEGVLEILNHDSNTKNVGYHPTGRIVGLQRGKYGTIPKDHMIVNKDIIQNNFKTYHWNEDVLMTPVPVTISDYAAATDNSILMTPSLNNHYTMLTATQTNQGSYNLFAIDFIVPNSTNIPLNSHKPTEDAQFHAIKKTKNVQYHPFGHADQTLTKKVKYTYNKYPNLSVGLFFNFDATGTIESTIFAEVSSEQRGENQEFDYYLNVYRVEKGKDGKPWLHYPGLARKVKISGINPFDGLVHRLTAYCSGKEIAVAIDGTRITTVEFTDNLQIRDKTSFGAVTKLNGNAHSGKVKIKEIYADSVPQILQNSINAYPIESRYYFTSQQRLNDFAQNKYSKNNCYLFQSQPRLSGFVMYDEKWASTPVSTDNLNLVKVQYGSKAIQSFNNMEIGALPTVVPSDVSYSDIFSTPFGFRMALANNKEGIVILSDGESGNSNHTPIQVVGKTLTLSEPKTITSIINPSYPQSVTLESQWFASRGEAEKMLKILSKAMDNFYVDIKLHIFPNPLIQVGDYATFIYSLKGIGYNQVSSTLIPITCLITSVDQAWSEGGENTILSLKPILT